MTRVHRLPSASFVVAWAVLLTGWCLGPLFAAPQTAVTAKEPQARASAASLGARMKRDIEALTAPGMDGRATGTAGGARARAWVEARFKAIGVRPAGGTEYARPFSFTSASGQTVSGANVVATCPGSQPTADAIVVSAHYDHLGIRGGKTYHGADDNASGVAMLMAVAERCAAQPFGHTLILAAFDAEEAGLRGAKAFVASPLVAGARVGLNVNFDMVGRSDRREIYIAGTGRWPRLRPTLTAAVKDVSVTVKFGHDTGDGPDDWTLQSDHGAFHQAGIPFVYFGVEDHADYHQPTDTPDKIAVDFLDGVAAAVLSCLTALDGAGAFK